MLKGFFGKRSEGGFRLRSSERDEANDQEAIGRVAVAIESALAELQTEQSGLTRRVEEAATMASLVVGTDSDEYISREQFKSDALHGFENEMKRGQDRLRDLEQHILNLRFLRAAFLTRFPGFKPLAEKQTSS